MSPLHYSCQYNQPQCAKILLLENGASIDLSCEAGFRCRELLQNSKIKAVFVDFYKKVDKAIMDQTSSKPEHASFNATIKKSISMIRPKSIVKKDVRFSMVADNIWKLH